ncbi:unnamed protein product [Ambrosiozyma monospora]|uniref:Unnamed protein product n=1 Tax=Ambrosiozyma monospora TaxID=43982 RepID=A0A9W7DC09_AMBMO|nr:unnamed protein product [Ambrosiozyma monospora]
MSEENQLEKQQQQQQEELKEHSITELISSIKADISTLQKELEPAKQSTCLITSSTPLLTALLTSLNPNEIKLQNTDSKTKTKTNTKNGVGSNDNITEDELAPLISYLLQYMTYEETASLALATIIELQQTPGLSPSEITKLIKDQLEDLISVSETRKERQQLFIVLINLFPIQIELCSDLLLHDSAFLKLFTNEITLLLGLNQPTLRLNFAHLDTVLSLMSTSCLDDQCRKVIAENYIGLLTRFLDLDGSKHDLLAIQCLSSSILIKVWKHIKKDTFKKHVSLLTLDNLTEILINGVIGFDKSKDDHKLLSDSIEGLAFLSLNVRIKKKLRNDDNFVSCLVGEATLQDPKITYGVLCIITNLTTYNKVLSKEQESIQYLKDHATLSNVNKETGERSKPEKDNDDEITEFIHRLLTQDKILSKIGKTINSMSPSKGILAQAIRNIHNLAYKPSERAEVVKQGGLTFVLTYLANKSEGVSYTAENGIKVTSPVDDLETRYFAIKTLTRILLNSNPNLLFGKKFDSVTPVPFLLEVVVQYDIEVHGTKYSSETPLSGLGDDGIETIDCFEALVALINLSSVDNETIKNLIVKLGWTALHNMMLSENVQIQRYVLELISNLIFSPLCSEKFFNWDDSNSENYKNFKTLCQMMPLNDLQAQLAVLNIFANCSEFEFVANKLADSELFVDNLEELFDEQPDNDEVMLRACYTLSNLCHLKDKKKLTKKIESLKPLLLAVMSFSENDEVKQLAMESLKNL